MNPQSVTTVPRVVQRLDDQEDRFSNHVDGPLEVYRDTKAWVLLGEPGAGKSTSLRTEATTTDGKYLTVAEFVDVDVAPKWRGKTLFLDGLDEFRASGRGTIIQKVCEQLKHLGKPPFRLACRAADWYGSSDKDQLRKVSPDEKFSVLQLTPLSNCDIRQLLHDNYRISNSQEFIDTAEQRGVDVLLQNPQTLGLLAHAVRHSDWPQTRDDTYRLACRKLVLEENKSHRDMKRASGNKYSPEQLINAAGQLCSVLLLADKSGVALDPDGADNHFPTLDQFSPPDPECTNQAIHSRIFRPDGEERLLPGHRSIAEYLAACWLARQIDNHSLPLKRVLNLLLGADGGVVAGLRGLYGWLALHCQTARNHLIDADPLTVILYGDPKPLPVADKRRLLKQLRHVAERFAGYRWHERATHAFAALAEPELQGDFKAILQSPDRGDASQAHVDCVLDILDQGEPVTGLTAEIYKIIVDKSRLWRLRKSAIKIWMRQETDARVKVNLLSDVQDGLVSDDDDETMGTLLDLLYPCELAATELLSFLHIPKRDSLDGGYLWFWNFELPENAPEDHLPVLADLLVKHPVIQNRATDYDHFGNLATSLLLRCLEVHGDRVNDRRLFNWLALVATDLGSNYLEPDKHREITAWFATRPNRYKALLEICYQDADSQSDPSIYVFKRTMRLMDLPIPNDLGLWHFQKAKEWSNETVAWLHFREATRAVERHEYAEGLSLEQLQAWSAAKPMVKQWLKPIQDAEYSEWEIKLAVRRQEHDQKRIKDRQENTTQLAAQLTEITTGTARANTMYLLAGVWKGHSNNVYGNTVADRFSNFCNNGTDVISAAATGFKLCPSRPDLPAAEEIIAFNMQQRRPFLHSACLLGMSLLHKEALWNITSLTEKTLRSMAAFYFTDGTRDKAEWFNELIRSHASVVAEVLILYAKSALKAEKTSVRGVYELCHDPAYRSVAMVAAPAILETYPVRASKTLLPQLNRLLKTALHYTPELLPNLIQRKLTAKGMSVNQKVYWHAAATLLRAEHEPDLWRYIGSSIQRANHLIDFFSNDFGDIEDKYQISATTAGRLIELLTPHAEMDCPEGGGRVTAALDRGNNIRRLISRLGNIDSEDAAEEIDRLVALETLGKLHFLLRQMRHDREIRLREAKFIFLSTEEVAQVINNKEPKSVADLAALTLDALEDVANDIRNENSDGFRSFWNVEKNSPVSQRDENLCRDVILRRLRTHLKAHEVDCQPEADYTNDNRADIRLSFKNMFELPIEIKRGGNSDLWRGLRKQLVEKYSIAPKAHGHGIYLVLWFGNQKISMAGGDGGKKPQSAQQLEKRLEAIIEPSQHSSIFVRTIDVSWPGRKKNPPDEPFR